MVVRAFSEKVESKFNQNPSPLLGQGMAPKKGKNFWLLLLNDLLA